jgi:4-amino-4-deoxy-L-arabinose transferase
MSETPTPLPRSRRALLGGVLAAVAFALALQGARSLWEPDEGRYVNVALEMIASGDWMTPRLHHQVPHYSKPPLTYWAIASSLELFGHSEWAARLPSALAFAATILLVGRAARRLAPGAEVTATIVYATSLLPFVAANIVSTDTLLAFTAMLGVAGFVELAFGDGSPRLARAMLWGGFGLAFLTKGPPGLLPLAALLVFAARDGRSWRGARRLASSASIALFLALAFAWYLHEIAYRPDLLRYLLGAEVMQRVGSPEFDRNSGLRGLFRAYVPVAIAAMLPWWPVALVRGWRRRAARPVTGAPRSREENLLLLWLLLPLAIFVIAQSRLPLYLLPLAAPASLLIARRLGPFPATRRELAGVLIVAFVLVGLKGLGARWPSDRDGRRFARELLERLPYPPGEVLFVEARPHYTLAFYLGCEVEEVDLATVQMMPRRLSYGPLDEPLAAELAESEPARVFLVTPGGDEAWRRELAELGYEARPMGKVDRYSIYLAPRRTDESLLARIGRRPRPPAPNRRRRRP